MPVPSGSDLVQKDPTTSSTTLALSQLTEAENGFQTQTKAVSDSNRGTEPQSTAQKEEALEDQEWLDNPAHPRNWPPGKKWTNMAIVSEFLQRFWGPRPRGTGALKPNSSHHLTFVILGFVLHVSTSAHELNDGARSATYR